MGIDVMIVSEAEDIASRPSGPMFDWLDDHLEDFDIRYGYVELEERDVADLQRRFGDEPIAQMLLRKVAAMKQEGERVPYTIELMVAW